MNDRCVRSKGRELAGDPVVEPCAERNQQVSLLQRAHRADCAVHTGHPHVLRVVVGEGAASHQRGDHRNPGELGELLQLLRRARDLHAASDVEHRALGRHDELCGFADLLAVRLGGRTVAREVDLVGVVEGRHRLESVFRDVDEHRTRPARRRDVERLGHGPRNLIGVRDEEVVLGDRHRDAADVGFLERVRTDGGRRNLAGDRDDRRGVHVGVRDRGDEVRCARS